MTFPDTRPTLIQRIATDGQEADWRQFLADYWGPVCRFAAGRGNLPEADAEDVASQAFLAILGNRLLARWVGHRSAKLRTLLCAVVRNILSNRARVEAGRARLVGARIQGDSGHDLLANLDAPADQINAFYTAWADDLLEQAVEALLAEYHRAGKGDYFRVLHGRLCEQMAMPEIATALGIKVTDAENYFKSARKRLTAILEDLVRQHVSRYAPEADQADEFAAEWARLGDYLICHGGLDDAVRAAYAGIEFENRQERRTRQIARTLARITADKCESFIPPSV